MNGRPHHENHRVPARSAGTAGTHRRSNVIPDPAVTPAEKVAFLESPDSYPDATTPVQTVETHRSWVFLTERHAYKLKKPGLYPFLDASTVAARKYLCEEELRLNKRLAGEVYIAVVPLTAGRASRLELEGTGLIVDWLVKMQRLPAASMLDAKIRRHELPEEGICRTAQKLAHFYQGSPPLGITAAEYRFALECGISANRDELIRPIFGLHDDLVRAVCTIQLKFLTRALPLFEHRTCHGRVVEAHGDLRPEHVCLLDPEPVIIDCLEFSFQLRTLDAASELAFLDQECERLDAPRVGEIIFDIYREITRDRPTPPLLNFYKSYWACLRAKLCAWHLTDSSCREPDKWSRRASDYLRRAECYASSI